MQDLSCTPSSTTSSPSPGASSYSGTTPGTALTRLSPEGQGRAGEGSQGHDLQPSPLLSFSTVNPREDTDTFDFPPRASSYPPFSVPVRNVRSGSVKLSPTAAPFTPQISGDIASTSSNAYSSRFINATNLTTPSVRSAALSDPFLTLGQPLQDLHLSISRPVRTSLATQDGTSSTTVDLGSATRYIQISQLSRDLAIEDLSSVLNNEHFQPPSLVVITEMATRGVIYVHYTDIREARTAFAYLRHIQPRWCVEFVSKARFIDVHHPGQIVDGDGPEARVVATAICDGPRQAFDARQVANMVTEFLTTFGELLSWKIASTNFPCLAVQADYYDMVAAAKAGRSSSFKHAGVTVMLKAHHSGLLDRVNATGNATRNEIQKESYGFVDGYTPRMSQTAGHAGDLNGNRMTPRSYDLTASRPGPVHLARTHEASVLSSRNGSLSSQHQRGMFSKAFRSHGDFATGHHNTVDIDRIRKGLDVRTTVMLRNIPNKITQAMLKEIVDETSHGKYDFMYLRIDFANNCNVGYAFINFEDPWYITDFVQSRAGRRWNRFSSDKVAEVSYAAIQGKDCLIQKFRNSSVMMEHPSFRPKIFRTGSATGAGEEEKFPGPDNASKMRRSVENAEHVGLFAPRGANQHREEKRRRRSQFDRGSNLAEMETATDLDPRYTNGMIGMRPVQYPNPYQVQPPQPDNYGGFYQTPGY